MTFFSVFLCLLLERMRRMDPKGFPFNAFARYADLIARNFNAGRRRHGLLGWAVAVLPWVVVADAGFYLLRQTGTLTGFLLAMAWSVGVLYLTMGVRQFGIELAAVQDAVGRGNQEEAARLLTLWTGEDASEYTLPEITRVAIENALSGAHRNGFGIIAWYAFLPALLGSLLPGFLGLLLSGPGGAVLYRLTSILATRWSRPDEEEFRMFGGVVRDIFSVIDWVPARLSALSFAIVGDFEDAVYCWRSQALTWVDHGLGVVLASGAGALGVRLGDSLHRNGSVILRPELGLGEDADQEHLNGATGLIWRALVLWLLIIALVTVASWVD